MATPRPMTSTRLSDALYALRRVMVYVLLFSFVLNLLSLLLPIYSLQVFDRVITSHSLDTLFGLTLVVLVGYGFFGIIFTLRASVIARVLEWLEARLTPELLTTAIRSASEARLPSAAEPLRELQTIRNFIAAPLPMLMDIPFALLFLLVITLLQPVLGVMTLLGMLLIAAAALANEYATRLPLRQATRHQVESLLNADRMGAQAEAIEAMGMRDAVLKHWEHAYQAGLTSQELAQSRSAMLQGFSRSLRLILQLAVIGVGAWLTINQQLSPGGLVAASILVARALGPFENVLFLYKQMTLTRDAYSRLQRFLMNAPMPRGETALPKPSGTIEVAGLGYSPAGHHSILRGVSFRLAPGESLGIIGPAAAGKSTLAKCLVGVLPPTQGLVRLDGADVYHWSRADFGLHVGYLPQSVELFPGTLKQNIARMQTDASDEAVTKAAQRAGVHELILSFKDAYDTVYVPGQSVLSPGQKQRIGLARALFGEVRLVVLDEPNSNLDSDGERALIQAISTLKREGVTLVIIAHRPSIMRSVDTILMLRGGQVEAIGARDTIIARYTPGKPTGGRDV
ncbi:MAG: type I secretion system permease/ATPase [Alphaproteobacteria bacterium]